MLVIAVLIAINLRADHAILVSYQRKNLHIVISLVPHVLIQLVEIWPCKPAPMWEAPPKDNFVGRVLVGAVKHLCMSWVAITTSINEAPCYVPITRRFWTQHEKRLFFCHSSALYSF